MKVERPTSGWKLQREPTTPGEMLMKEFLEPFHLSQHALAVKIGVPATRIADIVHGRRAISADTALRLGRFFDTSPQFWLNLQQACDLYATRSKLGQTIEEQVPVHKELMAAR